MPSKRVLEELEKLEDLWVAITENAVVAKGGDAKQVLEESKRTEPGRKLHSSRFLAKKKKPIFYEAAQIPLLNAKRKESSSNTHRTLPRQ